jgi:predicted membrane protein
VYRGEAFYGARLDACCGGIRMDLRNAAITGDEEIEIHTFCGGVELLVPQTVNVVVKSRTFIGGVGNHATRNADPKAPTIHIIADNFLGGVDIKN